MPHDYTFTEKRAMNSIRCTKVHEHPPVCSAKTTVRFVTAR